MNGLCDEHEAFVAVRRQSMSKCSECDSSSSGISAAAANTSSTMPLITSLLSTPPTSACNIVAVTRAPSQSIEFNRAVVSPAHQLFSLSPWRWQDAE